MTPPLIWFPYYAQDIEARVRKLALSLEAEGALHRALRAAWLNDPPASIPNTPDALARIFGAEWKRARALIEKSFMPDPAAPGLLVCDWLCELHARQLEKQRNRSGAAKTAALAPGSGRSRALGELTDLSCHLCGAPLEDMREHKARGKHKSSAPDFVCSKKPRRQGESGCKAVVWPDGSRSPQLPDAIAPQLPDAIALSRGELSEWLEDSDKADKAPSKGASALFDEPTGEDRRANDEFLLEQPGKRDAVLADVQRELRSHPAAANDVSQRTRLFQNIATRHRLAGSGDSRRVAGGLH